MESDSLELLGDLYIRESPQNLVEREELLSSLSLDESAAAFNTFFITITAKLTQPAVLNVEGLDYVDGRSVKFWKTFSTPIDTLVSGGIAACDAVTGMLSEVNVPPWGIGVSRILEWARRMVNDRQLAHDDDQTRVLHMEVYIDAFVDELPVPSENANYEIEDDNREAERISFDEYHVRFVPASKESIESLEKVRVMEKEASCTICLDDVLVGSEAIQLPCSHIYHGDCIVEWLQNSKFCPLCRFEISG